MNMGVDTDAVILKLNKYIGAFFPFSSAGHPLGLMLRYNGLRWTYCAVCSWCNHLIIVLLDHTQFVTIGQDVDMGNGKNLCLCKV